MISERYTSHPPLSHQRVRGRAACYRCRHKRVRERKLSLRESSKAVCRFGTVFFDLKEQCFLIWRNSVFWSEGTVFFDVKEQRIPEVTALQSVAGCWRVLQGVAVWCSVLQCVAVCCGVLQYAAVCSSALQMPETRARLQVDIRYSVLQCVAVCCSVLQCVAVYCSVLQCVAVCCSVLQCVAVWCSVLQCVAVCCSVFLFPRSHV